MEMNQIQGLEELMEKFMQFTQIHDQILELEKEALKFQQEFNLARNNRNMYIYIKTFAEFKDFLLKNLPEGTQIKKSLMIEMLSNCMLKSKSLSLNYLLGGSEKNKLKSELVSAAFKCLFESYPLKLYEFRKQFTKNQLEKLHSQYHEFYVEYFKFKMEPKKPYSGLEHKCYMRAFNHCAYEYEWKIFYENCVVPILGEYNKLIEFKNSFNFPQKYMEIIDSNLLVLKLSM